MWSLPDITRMNQDAVAKQAVLEVNAEKLLNEQGEPLQCEVCSWSGDETAADEAILHYDIFSDVPKGVYGLCEEHNEESACGEIEGFFWCDGCERIQIENITWERYEVIYQGERLCINCARKEILAEEDYWFDPRAVQKVVLQGKKDGHDPYHGALRPVLEDGVLYLDRIKHLLAVDIPCPDDLEFIENTESLDYPERMCDDVLRICHDLAARSKRKACIILDAAYQFSISFGVYIPKLTQEQVQEERIARRLRRAQDREQKRIARWWRDQGQECYAVSLAS